MTASRRLRFAIPALMVATLLQGCESHKSKTQPATLPLESPQITPHEKCSESITSRDPSIPSGLENPFHFTSMLPTSGISFRHESGDSAEKAFPAANGSGVATLDFDMDGRYDLYF